MENINTVTISVDEYFELRQKVAMNEFLLKEFGLIDARFMELERRYDELKWNISELKRSAK